MALLVYLEEKYYTRVSGVAVRRIRRISIAIFLEMWFN